jgi:hypothetical protein
MCSNMQTCIKKDSGFVCCEMGYCGIDCKSSNFIQLEIIPCVNNYLY